MQQFYFSREEISMDVELLINKQLNSYTSQNMKGLLETYSHSIEFRRLDDNKLLLRGHEEVRNFHLQNTFKRGMISVEIVNRIIIGNYVFDHEIVDGLYDNQLVEAICIYETDRSKICKIWTKNILFKTT